MVGIYFSTLPTMNINHPSKEPAPQARQKDPAGQAGRV